MIVHGDTEHELVWYYLNTIARGDTEHELVSYHLSTIARGDTEHELVWYCDRFKICTFKIKILSQNEYYDYYWWAELQVTFCFISRIAPVPEVHPLPVYVPETGSIRITNNKVKQGRDGACWLYQGQICMMPFVDRCVYKNWIIIYNAA